MTWLNVYGHVLDLQEFLTTRALWLADYADQLRLLTSQQANAIIVVAVIALAVPIINLWLKHQVIGHVSVVLASIAPPAALVMLLQVPSGFSGTPDDHCAQYDGGKLVFTLLKTVSTPADPTDIYGHDWLIMLVRASRWGNEPHQCRISLDDPKGKELAKQLSELNAMSSRYSSGGLTFSFGSRYENPNVKVPVLTPPQKVTPPEVTKKQDT